MSIILKTLQRDGIYIIPNYYSQKLCNEIITSIDETLENNSKNLTIHFNTQDEGMSGDVRVFGFENIYSDFLEDTFLFGTLNEYAKNNGVTELTKCLTLSGKLEYSPHETRNSGGNWHRDQKGFQVKAILFLSDVTEENGPFQFIPNSTTDIGFHCESNRIGEDYPEYIESLKNKKTIMGEAGTLVLVNTANIHRGDIIKQGERYTLTNYYMNSIEGSNAFKKRF